MSNDVTPKQAKRRVLAAVALRFRCMYLDRCGLGWPLAPPPLSVAGKDRFASWDAAVATIRDGDTLYIAGLTGNQMITGFHYSLLRRHRRTAKPTGLTIVCHGGNGGRGKSEPRPREGARGGHSCGPATQAPDGAPPAQPAASSLPVPHRSRHRAPRRRTQCRAMSMTFCASRGWCGGL